MDNASKRDVLLLTTLYRDAGGGGTLFKEIQYVYEIIAIFIFLYRICWSPTAKGDFDVSGKTMADTAAQTGTNKVN